MSNLRQQKLVSVIVPSYNCEKTIVSCVNSILKQTYSKIEIIIVDDSTDRTFEICEKKYGNLANIKMVHRGNEKGVASARNLGIQMASGEYISFCDADDTMKDSMLETMVDYQEKYGAEVVCCSYIGKKGWITQKDPYVPKGKEESVILLEQCGGFLWNKLFNKEVLSGISFEDGIELCEDVIFLIKCINKIGDGKMVYIPEKLYHYSLGGITTGCSNKHFENNVFLYEKAMLKACEILGDEWEDYFRHRTFILAVIENDFDTRYKCLSDTNRIVLRETLKRTSKGFWKDEKFSMKKRILFLIRYLFPYSKFIVRRKTHNSH